MAADSDAWWNLDIVSCRSRVALGLGETAYRLIPGVVNPGETMVFLHSAHGFSYEWFSLVKRMEGSQRRMLLVDMYGRGGSPWPPGASGSVEMFAKQVFDLLDVLDLLMDGQTVILIGQGMGAAVAAAVAEERPTAVSGMLLLSPTGVAQREREQGPESDVCTPLLGDALFASNAVAYLESVHLREFAGDGVSSQLADLHVKMVDWQVKNTKGYIQGAAEVLRNFPFGMGPRKDWLAALPGLAGEAGPGMRERYAHVIKDLRRRQVPVGMVVGSESGADAKADAMGLLESVDHLTVAEGCGTNISLGGAGDAASALQRVVEDPSRTVKGAKEIAAEAVVRVQGPPHSMQELERALELATNSCVGGPLVENVHRLIKFRRDGFAAAAEITRAVELRDRQRLVGAVNAGGRLMENESISLIPCLCDECYSWREAVYVGTETLKVWIKSAIVEEVEASARLS